jgi:hypothetical protein
MPTIRIDKDGNLTGDVDQVHFQNKVLYALQGLDPKDAEANEATFAGGLILKKGLRLSGTLNFSVRDGKIFVVCLED